MAFIEINSGTVSYQPQGKDLAAHWMLLVLIHDLKNDSRTRSPRTWRIEL